MKKFWLFLVWLPTVITAQFEQEQIIDPIKWYNSVEKTGENTYNLIFEADIEDDWHLYSQFNDPMGSLPIEFEWKDQKGKYEVIGKAKEVGTHQAYNDVFKVTETFFSKHAKLIQPIKILDNQLKKIEVTLYGQACKEACIQIKKDFSFDLTKAVEVSQSKTKKNNTNLSTANKDDNNNTISNPKKHTSVDQEKTEIKTSENNSIKNIETENEAVKNTLTENEQVAEAKNTEKQPIKRNNWSVFWTAFIAGLLVLITPCVFPMIPLTVSFFTKQSEKSSQGKLNALVYTLSIVLIYVLFSLPFHLLEKVDSAMFNNIATNTWVNLFFFIIFMLFALNLFGIEKLDPMRLIPNSWINTADKQSNKGGILVGFFMALTLVIVSFSCTGPALGFILGNAASGAEGAITFSYAMLGFGLGIAIPFGILSFFPVLLKTLPQSGAWLNSVKVVFGFIELAFAFKFLSNADLVNQWGFLQREVFIAIWIAITLVMAMYLFGKIQLPHDAPVQNLSVFRFLFGVFTLSFAIYMFPGLWGAPLNIISGFPPPIKYAESKFGVGYTQPANNCQDNEYTILPQGAKYGPNNIVTFEDYDIAMEYAKEVGKPLLIDFTGRACQNCRLMEENVWSKQKILNILNNKVVLVSLYVDERTKLPENEQYVSKYSGKKITTVGEKWSEMETYIYKNNSQPLYVLIDHNEKPLNEPIGYTPDVDEYYKWLKKGIDNFKK